MLNRFAQIFAFFGGDLEKRKAEILDAFGRCVARFGLEGSTLEKIAESQARIFILDISGVGVVDTAVANHLIKISRATRLMGCECVISGVSPSIAQTIVDLGIDVGDVKTTSTMKDALATAFKQLGMEIQALGG